MANVRITDAMQQAAMDAVVDSIDTGGAGTIKIYDGTQPADSDTAVSTQTLLATLTFSATALVLLMPLVLLQPQLLQVILVLMLLVLLHGLE